jgi:C4-dicarboxylate transporter, DctM subunit
MIVDLLLFFVLPMALLLVGMPIYATLMLSGMAAIVLAPNAPIHAVQTVLFGALNNFSLLAIPLFVVAGDLMAQGGLAKRLVAWVLGIVGGIRGSLPLATVGSSAVFGAMSGSAIGCMAAVGRIMYPDLRRAGYSPRFCGGLMSATGAIDVVIPPSIPIIIYGIVAQQSIPDLFLAGFLPGLLVAGVIAAYVLIYARVVRVPEHTEAVVRPGFLQSTREAAWALGAPLLILGGIYGGVFTPTEAAGVAVVYAVIVSRYVYKELAWADVWKVTSSSMFLVGQLLMIVAGAALYAWAMTLSGLAQKLGLTVSSLDLATWQLLLAFNILLLLAGSFLEPPAAILILTPVFLPIMQAAGVHPIHLGMVMTVNLAIGMFTPPLGINLFAANALFKVDLPTLYRGVLPFLLLYIGALLCITYVPAISLAPLQWFK